MQIAATHRFHDRFRIPKNRLARSIEAHFVDQRCMPSYDSVEPHPIEVESEGVDRLLPSPDLDDFFFWRKKGAAHEKLKRSSRKIEETGSKRRMLPSTMGSCFRIVPGKGRIMHGCLTFDPKDEENWMHVMESDGPVQGFVEIGCCHSR